MSKVTKKLRRFGRYTWEMFKGALPALLVYLCMGLVLIMLGVKGEDDYAWDSRKTTWTSVCWVCSLAYNGLLAFAQGGNHYEMLVSGNVKRMSMDEYGNGYKISTHKEAKEYRPWKGFAIGGWIGIFAVIAGIVWGANQAAIDGDKANAATGICLLLVGWACGPFYFLSATPGVNVSYYLICLLGLAPVLVSGGLYIAGAYARRNKQIRQQQIADALSARAMQKEKKINYGGLPGTKPRKHK